MFAEVAFFLPFAYVFRETIAALYNHIGKDMSCLRMRVDQQNSQAGKVALRFFPAACTTLVFCRVV